MSFWTGLLTVTSGGGRCAAGCRSLQAANAVMIALLIANRAPIRFIVDFPARPRRRCETCHDLTFNQLRPINRSEHSEIASPRPHPSLNRLRDICICTTVGFSPISFCCHSEGLAGVAKMVVSLASFEGSRKMRIRQPLQSMKGRGGDQFPLLPSWIPPCAESTFSRRPFIVFGPNECPGRRVSRSMHSRIDLPA